MERLLQRHPRGEIALVAHGGVCRAIIGEVLGVPIRNWLRIAQRHGCLNVLTWYESQPMVELLNYSSEEFPG
jgi:broad specificity phosphatase PhoE